MFIFISGSYSCLCPCAAKRLFLNLNLPEILFVSGLHNSVPSPGKIFSRPDWTFYDSFYSWRFTGIFLVYYFEFQPWLLWFHQPGSFGPYVDIIGNQICTLIEFEAVTEQLYDVGCSVSWLHCIVCASISGIICQLPSASICSCVYYQKCSAQTTWSSLHKFSNLGQGFLFGKKQKMTLK